MNLLNALFVFDGHRPTLNREVVAGLTTFTTMSYIVVVNPAILSAAGVPEGPSLAATALVAAIGCFLMAFYANRPFALAPYMGGTIFQPQERQQSKALTSQLAYRLYASDARVNGITCVIACYQ